MSNKRKQKRFIKRCETEFTANGVTCRGITNDFSMNGLYIKTARPLPPDTEVDIVVHFPDGSMSCLSGLVKRSDKLSFGTINRSSKNKSKKSGMGVEIFEKDANFLHLIGSLISIPQGPGATPKKTAPDTAEMSDTSKFSSTKDLLMHIILIQQALINLLANKGIINKKDLVKEIKDLRKT
jgi:hypothetical protein